MRDPRNLVIRSRRWSYLALLLLTSAFGGFCVYTIGLFARRSDPYLSDYVLFLGLLVASAFAARAALQRVIKPPQIEFGDAGLTLSVAGRVRVWPWTEIETALLCRTRRGGAFVALWLKPASGRQSLSERGVMLTYPFKGNASDLHKRILQRIPSRNGGD